MNLSTVAEILRGKAMVAKGGFAQKTLTGGLDIHLYIKSQPDHWEEVWTLGRGGLAPEDEDVETVMRYFNWGGGQPRLSWRDDGRLQLLFERPKTKAAATQTVSLPPTPPKPAPMPPVSKPKKTEAPAHRDYYPAGGLLDKKLARVAERMGIEPHMMEEHSFPPKEENLPVYEGEEEYKFELPDDTFYSPPSHWEVDD